MRAAIFYSPPPEHPLARAAALWLGRDAFSGETFRQMAGEGVTRQEVEELTAAPRRYGFHATFKPPFHLSADRRLAELEESLRGFCAQCRPVDLGYLRIERIGGFFALTPDSACAAVDECAAEIVRSFDSFRAPPSAEEIARRAPHRLSARQRDNLERWGYPYVFEDFRFHMTLTGPVPEARCAAMRQLLEKRFTALIDEPFVIDALSLFVEPAPPGDFIVSQRFAMSDAPQPVDAE